MKTYVLTLSRVFPASHRQTGKPTDFERKLRRADCRKLCPVETFCKEDCTDGWRKIHTIRANYELWHRRFKEIEEGKACLSVRQWSGEPYRSRQVELAKLTREDGIGIQELVFRNGDIRFPLLGVGLHPYTYGSLARNDGLNNEDWLDWFKSYDLSRPLAVIHFTDFRYSKEKERNESGNCNKD